MQAHEPRPRGRSNGASPCRARRTSTELFVCVWKQSSNITQLFFLGKFLTLQYFHIFEFSSTSCLFGFGRFRCALVFLILILGLFGSQPPFAKPKFGSHSLVGMCLVFATLWHATLYCSYGPLVIETMFPHLPKVGSSKRETQVSKPKGILPHFVSVCHAGP